MALKQLAMGLAAAALATAAKAQTLSPELAPIGFIVGDWVSAPGNASPDRGSSSIQPIVGGAALLRNDHHEVVDTASGKTTASFDQVMPIYAEGGTLRGDYFDGTHIIHYTHAIVAPGASVQFLTATDANPAYRLTYTKISDEVVAIRFEVAAPGSSDFHVIADARVQRRR